MSREKACNAMLSRERLSGWNAVNRVCKGSPGTAETRFQFETADFGSNIGMNILCPVYVKTLFGVDKGAKLIAEPAYKTLIHRVEIPFLK